MPRRLIPLVKGEYYHVFNRGIDKQPISKSKRDFKRVMNIFPYYLMTEPPMSYSKFIKLSRQERNRKLSKWKDEKKLAEVICFCFMPNHYHFLLKQKTDDGISRFMSRFQNSYTRFFNKKYDRVGPILQGQFKAIRIEDDAQLVQVNRYIHLNPYSSFVISNLEDLEKYQWSSFGEYLEVKHTGICICNKEIVMFEFSNKIERYKKFVLDRADYQRQLERIKHLIIE